jgi:hypothetical protein
MTTEEGNRQSDSCAGGAPLSSKTDVAVTTEVYRPTAIRGFSNWPKLDNPRLISLEAKSQRCLLGDHTSFSSAKSPAASGRVALGDYSPRAPTDPDVPALEHPVPRPTDSPSTVVPTAIQPTDVDMFNEPQCVQHVSLDQVCWPTLRFPPLGPPGRVPQLRRYYQSATTSCCPFRRTSFPSFGSTSVALVVFAPRQTSKLPEPGVVNPVSPPGSCRGSNRISQVPGEPHIRLHMFQTDAGRTACTRPIQYSNVALGHHKAKAPTIGSFDAQ